MPRPRFACPRAARLALAAALLANALDLSTSLIPAPIDSLAPLPQRPVWLLLLQVALLVPLLVLAQPVLRRAFRGVRALPLPRPALAVLSTVFVVQGAHVALRMEHYPFSPVIMFSNEVGPLPAGTPWRSVPAALMGPGSRAAYLSFLREGNPLFSRYDLDLDYKAGWVLYMYARELQAPLDEVAAQLDRRGFDRPSLGTAIYRLSDGYVVVRQGAAHSWAVIAGAYALAAAGPPPSL